MDCKKQRQLIDAVLSDWPAARRKRVLLSFEGRCVTAAVQGENGDIIKGVAKCHPIDKFDDFSGAVFALARLRVRYAFRLMMRKFKTWIPAYGQPYYVPSVVGHSDSVASLAASRSIVWVGRPLDLMYLAMGLVFRTPKEAEKKARTLLFDGHNIRNVVNRLSLMDDVLCQSEDLPPDIQHYAMDLRNSLQIADTLPSVSDAKKRRKKQKKKEKRMQEEAELAEQTKFDPSGFSPEDLAMFNDDELPPDVDDEEDEIQDTDDEKDKVLMFSELFGDDDDDASEDLEVTSWEPVMQRGKRYLMDAVTGDVVLAEP